MHHLGGEAGAARASDAASAAAISARARHPALNGPGTAKSRVAEVVPSSSAQTRPGATFAIGPRLLFPFLLVLSRLLAVPPAAAAGGSSGNSRTPRPCSTPRSSSRSRAPTCNSTSRRAEGIQQLNGPLSVKLNGPYESSGSGTAAQVRLQRQHPGGGQSLPLAARLHGRQPLHPRCAAPRTRSASRRWRRSTSSSLSRPKTKSRKSLLRLRRQPAELAEGREGRGDTTMAGDKVTHVSAQLDVGKLLDDLNTVISKADLSGPRYQAVADHGGAAGPDPEDTWRPEPRRLRRQERPDPAAAGDHDQHLGPEGPAVEGRRPDGRHDQVLDRVDQRGRAGERQPPANPQPISGLASHGRISPSLGGLGGGSSSSGAGSSSSEAARAARPRASSSRTTRSASSRPGATTPPPCRSARRS